MFRKFHRVKRMLFSPKKEPNFEKILQRAMRKVEAGWNNIHRAESRKIKFDGEIIEFEKERWKISAALIKQEKDLLGKVKFVQALETVIKSMQIIEKKESELKSVSYRFDNYSLTLNNSIEKLVVEINFLERIPFPINLQKQKSYELITQMQSIINRVEEIIKGAKVTAADLNKLLEKYHNLSARAKDLTENHY